MADVTNVGSAGGPGVFSAQPVRRSRALLERRGVLTPAGNRINFYPDTEVELVDSGEFIGVVIGSLTSGGRKKWIPCENLEQARYVRDTLAALANDLDGTPDPDWTGMPVASRAVHN